MKELKEVSTPSPSRIWYNNWVDKNAKGNVLDVGKSRFWDYGFPTIDKNKSLEPTFIGDIQKTAFPDDTFDTILCHGVYQGIEYPQKMVDECMRILKPGGTVLFGFVGRGYTPNKREWLFYEEGDIEFKGVVDKVDQDNQYHFITCKK